MQCTCNIPAAHRDYSRWTALEKLLCICIDDLLVCSQTFQEHLEHLSEMFARLRKAGLRLISKKCLFLREVPYLGYVVTKCGIRPDTAKTEKVQNYPIPTRVTQVRQFLGLASYYRRFVQDFSKTASPFHSLLKKDAKFQWIPKCDAAFQKLKALLVTAPVLSYPLFESSHPFILETDASSEGLGVYVDDIILAGTTDERIKEVEDTLSRKFEIKDIGRLHYSLGMTMALYSRPSAEQSNQVALLFN